MQLAANFLESYIGARHLADGDQAAYRATAVTIDAAMQHVVRKPVKSKCLRSQAARVRKPERMRKVERLG